ncbi:hypothetical protein Pmar_PMAR012577 [Perkinsus marinus ATCC 50983]|uniref:Uncharacterized protein n=1 Tax=Perkinsus marinus (strain ATCC 50983 / TXsc) TaxID=423536 RepID=C5K7R0_PERM5|nr:hypothetical protein Pmar_PMAR012577 [Perkinsus marinus ATCC 50983]EER19595.1 hypothetical protein Pmar_PMAR012577 [Perkinsus marinus ATCC 50983]|eukprot:XP_002787799.1 hypothetical protein Pmar_PMAR012577 [Perkinsus marinus ATCC 50983]
MSFTLVITIISLLAHSIQASSSAFVIAEKLLRGSGDHCQIVCDERPDCIFSYCGDDHKCHNLGEIGSNADIPC